jgi:1-acyl-sn-glycerol-3-phosphate acyltransferase
MSAAVIVNARVVRAGPINLRDAALGHARRSWYALRRIWWSTFWRLEVNGLANLPRRGPFLLCGNHTSHLDAPAILASLPRELALRTSTAAAKDVFGDVRWREVVSRVITNALPIERGAGFSRGLRDLEVALHDRRPLILFPEGRRSTDGNLLDFKPGAAMLALRTVTPIIPVRIEGAGGPGGSLPRGGYFPRPHGVSVCFGPAIAPRPYVDLVTAGRMTKREAYERLTTELRKAIAALAPAPGAA